MDNLAHCAEPEKIGVRLVLGRSDPEQKKIGERIINVFRRFVFDRIGRR